ncbi:hypothetical protein YKV023c [Yokapox virus]|uniref:Uncharacterized protein n=1 Tax=Yokapox virus TaxID=1076255 RepID=G3EIA1_9POXV|nr:hypothetical protein YKV023c [Yokapox virus]AEN03612.1 unknown protein [Yokapox virus]
MDRIKKRKDVSSIKKHQPSYDEISKFGQSLNNIKMCTEKKEICLKNNYPSVISSLPTEEHNNNSYLSSFMMKEH